MAPLLAITESGQIKYYDSKTGWNASTAKVSVQGKMLSVWIPESGRQIPVGDSEMAEEFSKR